MGTKNLRVNEEIRSQEIRLIGPQGEQRGIISRAEGLRISQEMGLDLVEVAPQANPPVCRIMDYGKYCYEQSKREREARKRQKITEVKEVKLRAGIEEHDFQVKVRNALRFLSDGDKVKVTVIFRGREISHLERGKDLCIRFVERLQGAANVEKPPALEGRSLVMILAPKAGEAVKARS